MGAGIAITRLDLNASDQRCHAQRAGSIEAARNCGMDRQTLRDWVHRYNAGGLRGLSNRRPPGVIAESVQNRTLTSSST
jgi:transposase-like protein